MKQYHPTEFLGTTHQDRSYLRPAENRQNHSECKNQLIEQHILSGDINKEGIEAIRAVGSGSSPWIQLTQYLMRLEMEREAEK